MIFDVSTTAVNFLERLGSKVIYCIVCVREILLTCSSLIHCFDAAITSKLGLPATDSRSCGGGSFIFLVLDVGKFSIMIVNDIF